MDFMGATSSFKTAANQRCFGAHQGTGGALVKKNQIKSHCPDQNWTFNFLKKTNDMMT